MNDLSTILIVVVVTGAVIIIALVTSLIYLVNKFSKASFTSARKLAKDNSTLSTAESKSLATGVSEMNKKQERMISMMEDEPDKEAKPTEST